MKLILVEKRLEAKDTFSFFWKPERRVNYLPGQYYYFTLPYAKGDSRGPTRHFTLSSSPTESEIIRFTTRIRDDSGYKQSLKMLKKGTKIEGEGPNGTFILDENEPGPHVLLAGGIGITPFRSFIKYNIDKNLTQVKIHLIYTNSLPEEIAFKDELETWAKEHENIKIEMTVSRPEESKLKWDGITGRIDDALIRKLITNNELRIANFWVCGPPAMVDALEQTLGKLRVTSDKVRSEKFTGY